MRTPVLLGVDRASLPPVLRRVAVCLPAMMAASLAFIAVTIYVLHLAPPFTWIFNYWCDFFVFQDQSLHFGTPAYWSDYGYPFTYPAPVGVIFGFFYKLRHPLWTYLLILACAFAAWVVWLARGLAARGIPWRQAAAFALVVLGTAWPVYYLFDTGNIEGLMAILMALGVLAVLRDRTWLGAALIGFAAAMKYFPIAMLALLLSKRRYKEFCAGLALIAGLTLGSLALMGPNIPAAQSHLNVGAEFLRKNYLVLRGARWLDFSHSLFNPLKYAVLLADRILRQGGAHASPAHEQALLDSSLRAYMLVVPLLAAALYFGRIRRLPMLNQVLALTACAVVLPPFSSDYTLVHLLAPFGLLSFYAVDLRRDQRSLQVIFACLCLILGFESFLTWKYAFASCIRATALLALVAAALSYPLPWEELDGRAA
jgi:hypothetical protein